LENLHLIDGEVLRRRRGVHLVDAGGRFSLSAVHNDEFDPALGGSVVEALDGDDLIAVFVVDDALSIWPIDSGKSFAASQRDIAAIKACSQQR